MSNVLLQLLDDGGLKDRKRRRIDFRVIIIILTSNLWSGIVMNGIDENCNLPFNQMNFK